MSSAIDRTPIDPTAPSGWTDNGYNSTGGILSMGTAHVRASGYTNGADIKWSNMDGQYGQGGYCVLIHKNTVPLWVTGDRTSSITVTAGGPNIDIWSGNISNSVDGGMGDNATDAWAWGMGAPTPGPSDYVRFDFGESTLVTDARGYKLSTYNQGSWKWQGSNDASSWIDIGGSFNFSGATPAMTGGLASNTTGYRYYQMVGTSGNTITSAEWMREVEFKQCAR